MNGPHEGPAPESAAPADTVPRWRVGVSLNWINETTLPSVKRFAVKRRFNVSNLNKGN